MDSKNQNSSIIFCTYASIYVVLTPLESSIWAIWNIEMNDPNFLKLLY